MANEDLIGNAISDYLTEMRPDASMLVKYFVVAEFIDSDGEPCWFIKAPQGQDLGTTAGLITWADLDVKHQINKYLDRLYEEEDD